MRLPLPLRATRRPSRRAARAADQPKKNDALQARAEQDPKTDDALTDRGGQFDRSDALIAIAIAIAMPAVTALTRLWALYRASLVPTVSGILVSGAGPPAERPIHPDSLARWLS